MKAVEREELENLKKRFPHIQEIHGDSMDMAILSGVLFVVGAVLLFRGHPWNWFSTILRCAGALLSFGASIWFDAKATLENEAIQRYFEFLNKEDVSDVGTVQAEQ